MNANNITSIEAFIYITFVSMISNNQLKDLILLYLYPNS